MRYLKHSNSRSIEQRSPGGSSSSYCGPGGTFLADISGSWDLGASGGGPRPLSGAPGFCSSPEVAAPSKRWPHPVSARKRPTGAVGALRGQPCAAQPRAPPQTARLHVRGYVAAPGPARPGLTCVVQVGHELRRPGAITGLGSRQLLRPRESGPGGRSGRVAPAWVPPAAPPSHPWP